MTPPPFSNLPTADESTPADRCLVCFAYGEKFGEIVKPWPADYADYTQTDYDLDQRDTQ